MSQIVETFSSKLAFPELKRKAVASRSFRTKISPASGNQFNQGATCKIHLPGNLQGQFYDFSNMYLKFKVTSTNDGILDRGGAYSFIQRISMTTAGAQIMDLDNYNVLATALLDQDATSEWKASTGNVLIGTYGDSLRGEVVGAGGRTYCLPMVLTPMSMTTPHRMIPAFSLSSIEMNIVFANGDVALQSGAACVLTYTDVELVCMMTELNPMAMAELNSRTGGQYNILCNNYQCVQNTLPAGVTQYTAQLGVSVSSLERILLVQRPAPAAPQGYFSLGHRGTAGLSSFQYSINGEQFPARPIERVDNSAEAMAEMLISNHCLTDFKSGNGIQNGTTIVPNTGLVAGALSGMAPQLKANPFSLVSTSAQGTTAGSATLRASNASDVLFTASVPSNIGTFLCACEFESGLSHGASSSIYSGVSTLASNVVFRGTYAAGHDSFDMCWFALHTIILSLNMKQGGVFSVSV